MKAIQKLHQRMITNNSLVCVGLDPDMDQIPGKFQQSENPQFAFNKHIIDQTHQFTAAFKPNMAFYEARGEEGWRDLRLTMEYLEENHPDIFTICDAKRADIGNTNRGYVKAIFDDLGFDAITLHPYLGQEALRPFLEREDKVSIILCKTSNPGSGELQDLALHSGTMKMWEKVAQEVSNAWNQKNNCMLVVGGTYPEEIQSVREIVGEMDLLIPGIGAQGGDLHSVVHHGLNAQARGLLISSSRSIIFASDPAAQAQLLRDEIRTLLES